MTDRSLVGSDQPPLEQGDHAVNPWHQLRWSLLLPFEKSDLVLVALVLQGQVPQPAVGVDDAAGCDRILHKWNQAFGRSVQNLAHANSTESRSIFLSGNNDQSFLQIESAGQSLFQAADIAFIHFDSAGEQITSRSYHGAAQFMQHRPGCLIFFQPQHSLQSQRAGPVLLRGHPPHRAKPHGQRNACVLEDRSGRHRSLAPTCRTLPQTPHRPPTRSGDNGNRSATEVAPGTPDTNLRWRSSPPTPSDHADTLPPPPHTRYWAYLSQGDTHLGAFVYGC